MSSGMGSTMKTGLKKYGVNAILLALVILLWISPDAKAWVMRRVLSTGILNFRFQTGWVDSRSADEPIQKALVFSAESLSGKTTNLNELRGKVVFINFWASWCPPCRAELPSVQEFYDSYKDNSSVVFMIVNMDDNPERGMAFLDKNSYTVPFLVTHDNIPPEIFQGSLPTTVVLDKNGRIRFTQTGMADYSSKRFCRRIDGLISE